MKISRLIKTYWAGLWAFVLFFPQVVFGTNHQFTLPPPPPTPTTDSAGFISPLRFHTIQEFFAALLDVIITIAFPFIILAIIYTGFLFVKAQGNSEELEKAKRAFLWTVIGALILLGAKAISLLIQGTIDQVI